MTTKPRCLATVGADPPMDCAAPDCPCSATPTPGMLRANISQRYVEVVAPTGPPVANWMGFDDSFRPHAEHAANARLIVAAWNSYARNTADPLAAAEGDLLGEALELLRGVLCVHDVYGNRITTEQADHTRALLARAKGVRP